jgi:hypothetical protein
MVEAPPFIVVVLFWLVPPNYDQLAQAGCTGSRKTQSELWIVDIPPL